ncbi:ROK family protein [Cohnella sp. GCM10012308]|uniref:ROK family protein n=1 Tax=Cohnella sp. GCM10012308 TaxID=3317329 RepID=UPI00361A0283
MPYTESGARQAGASIAHWVAFDIGGTDIKFAVFDGRANIVFAQSAATPQGEDAGRRIPGAACDILAGLLARFPNVRGVGISTAGVVDPDRGEIVYAGPTIPAYRGANWKREIEARFGLPAFVANDVNAAANGEHWRGAARGCDHFFCVTLGTGIGGALFADGKLLAGSSYRAGEIGHSLYDKKTGTTYERRASMSALLKRAAAEIPDLAGGGRELFGRARRGDAACERLIDDWSEEVARGLAEIALLADPALIVIGGAVSEQGDYLIDKLRGHLRAYLPGGFTQTELRAAELGNRAALYGALFPYFKKSEGELQDE